MKIMSLSGLLAVVTLITAGCQKKSAAPPTLEHKTIQTVEDSNTDIRKLMSEWSRDGWAVLSMSRAVTQADGTIHRTVELSRTKR